MLLALVALVVPLRQSAAATPILTFNPVAAALGERVAVSGDGLSKKARVQLTIDGQAVGSSLRTSANGQLKTTLTVPQLHAGPHTVVAMSVSSSGKGPRRSLALGATLAAGVLTVTAPAQATVTPSPSPSIPGSASIAATPTLGTTSPTPEAIISATPSSTLATATPTARPTTASPTPVASPPTTPSGGFVERQGSRLTIGGDTWRFTGTTIYNANSRQESTCWDTLNEGDRLSESLDQLKGQEVFRAWFYQGLALTNGKRDWSAFDKTLSVASRHGMRVIVSLSGQGGDCKDYPVDRPKFESWYRSGYKDPEASGTSYRDWIREVATRYRNDPTIAAYQLMGEAEDPIDASGRCSSTAAQTLKSWADDSAAVIKSVDPNHLVTVGVIGSGQCGASGDDFVSLHSGPNVDLCTREDYGDPTSPMPGDAWNGMAVRIEQCASLGKPLIVTESGIKRSVANRALLWDAKFSAQFKAGISGILIWDWSPRWIADGYELLPGDPALGLLQKY